MVLLIFGCRTALYVVVTPLPEEYWFSAWVWMFPSLLCHILKLPYSSLVYKNMLLGFDSEH